MDPAHWQSSTLQWGEGKGFSAPNVSLSLNPALQLYTTAAMLELWVFHPESVGVKMSVVYSSKMEKSRIWKDETD